MTTFDPSCAKESAISLPMPLAAPVSTATLSASRPCRALLAARALDRVLSCKFMGPSFPVRDFEASLVDRRSDAVGTEDLPLSQRAMNGAAARIHCVRLPAVRVCKAAPTEFGKPGRARHPEVIDAPDKSA